MAVNFNASFTEEQRFGASFTESTNLGASFGSSVRVDGVLPSDELPLMDGEASAGESTRFSRGDHRHPHDTTKQDFMTAITNLELEAMLT